MFNIMFDFMFDNTMSDIVFENDLIEKIRKCKKKDMKRGDKCR